MKILGIETSCDETSSAIVQDGVKVLSNTVSSSLFIHAKTGGIIPEVAAREQVKAMIPIIEKSIQDSTVSIKDIDAIAVTYGPGLMGSLIIGVETAKTLAYVWGKPLIPVNHLVGHVYANWLENPKPPVFPNLSLIVSGGHTELVVMKDHGKFQWLGGTRDDAAGEAFDKTARLIGLDYPGGPAIEKSAKKGDPKKFDLPRPMSQSPDFDFSYSGLKTAVVNLADKNKPKTTQEVADFAASIQEAIVDSLIVKTLRAAKKYEIKEILLGGGVAANSRLKSKLKKEFNGQVLVPEPKFSVDNAAMIAAAAYFNFHPVPWREIKSDPGILI